MPFSISVPGPDPFRYVALAAGPAIFIALWLAEPQYAGVGVLLWLAIYWASGAIPYIYTALISAGCFALLGVDLPTILASFVHPALFVIVGPAFAVLAAAHCGLMERIALALVKVVGANARHQVLFWLLFSTVISFFTADMVVAIALVPIVVQILRRAGYETAGQLANSKTAMLMIVAIAIGADVGGILTPMGGGQAAITWQALNTALGGEVTAWSFTTRMFPPVVGTMIIATVIFSFLPLDVKEFRFAPAPDRVPWMGRQIAVLFLLVATIGLPYIRPWLPASVSLPWIYAVLLAVMLCLPIPKVGTMLPFRALPQFPLQALSVWPIALSVSTLANKLGVGVMLFGLLGDFLSLPPIWAVGIFVLFCLVVAQLNSNAGGAALLAPLVLGMIAKNHLDPVYWILAMGFSVNLCFMVPTATGTVAIPLALNGKSHRSLMLYGFYVAITTGLFSWLFWTLVMVNGWTFWSTLDVIK